MTQQITASTSGIANFEFGEICANGMMLIALFARMKKNSAPRNGANGRPLGPMTSRAMPSRTTE
jgi:hypothetical protein